MLTFLTAVLLAGSALALPTAPQASASCHSKSISLKEWTVEDFDFHASYVFSTPAHQNSWGYVNFTLANPAVNYKPICSAASSQINDFFYGSPTYTCTNVPVQGDSATFTFDRPTNNLRINQTWNCADKGGRFTAQGGVKLSLNCTDTAWQNPDWTPGQIYSTRTVVCGKVTVPAPIETMSGVL